MFESKAPLHRCRRLEQSARRLSGKPGTVQNFLRAFNGPDDVVCRSLNCAPPVEILPLSWSDKGAKASAAVCPVKKRAVTRSPLVFLP